jgi:hypothetical protein
MKKAILGGYKPTVNRCFIKRPLVLGQPGVVRVFGQ